MHVVLEAPVLPWKLLLSYFISWKLQGVGEDFVYQQVISSMGMSGLVQGILEGPTRCTAAVAGLVQS